MQVVAVATGAVLGAVAAVVWHILSRRIETRQLFAALGRSVRAMLSDDGDFLRAYGALLVRVGVFILWTTLALAAALAPLAVVSGLFWTAFEGHQTLLIVVYSVISMGGIIWLGRRSARLGARAAQRGLSISDSQFFFLQLVRSAPWLLQRVAALESRVLRRRLETVRIDRPVFVTGLARSGTTMLLELLAQADDVATHRYRDFPFLMTPYFWNRYVDVFGVRGDAAPRPHQDGIQISPESPEAFEEPLWQQFFPHAHRPTDSHVLTSDNRSVEFDDVFVEHLRKLLLLRGATRYVSKGNYNVTRIAYLASLFPDARFVVPIRHPVTHVASLVRQHQLFSEYAEQDPRVPEYLKAAGHYEFGPQRVPISVDGSGEQVLAAWEAGDENGGYALQWAAVYRYVQELLTNSPELNERVVVVRYEDLCDEPRRELARILQQTELETEGTGLLERLDHIQRSTRHGGNDDPHADDVWRITEPVASAYGYEPPRRLAGG